MQSPGSHARWIAGKIASDRGGNPIIDADDACICRKLSFLLPRCCGDAEKSGMNLRSDRLTFVKADALSYRLRERFAIYQLISPLVLPCNKVAQRFELL